MPLHEYVCKDCNTTFDISGTFEMFISFVPKCPNCFSKNVRKKIFAPSLVFKGEGFYVTDNKESS